MIKKLDLKIIDNIVNEKKLVEKSVSSCKLHLKKWWSEDQNGFIEKMGADLETVFMSYRFEYAFYSLNKNHLSEKTLYYIEITIRIYDEENSDIMQYDAFFDDKLQIFNKNLMR